MLPSKHELKKYVDYDVGTGVFTYLVNSVRSGKFGFKAGDAAGYKTNGYIIIFIDGHKIRAHRAAWLFVTGEWPIDKIDHINGAKSDNRFSNLREASTSKNNMNRGPRGGRRYKGIWFDKQTPQWRVQVKGGGRVVSPGRFSNEEDAARCYNYHAAYLHGEFAVLNKIASRDLAFMED